MRLLLRMVAICAGFLIPAVLFLLFTEAFILLGFIALPFLAMRIGNRLWTTIAIGIAIIALVLHFSGYKLFGSARIVTSPPLPNARTLAALQPPNLLRFTSNETMPLADVYFPASVDFSKASTEEVQLEGEMRILNLRGALGYRNGPFLINVQADQTNHAITQRRMNYWCGNTFFPTFLPRRLPSHDTVDLGQMLVLAGLAIPLDQPGDDRAYRKELLQSLSRSQDGSYYFVTAKISRQDATAVALGRSLATSDSRYFVTGAYLLIAAQETDAYPALRREVVRRIGINYRDFDESAQNRSEDFDTILVWVDGDEARRQLLPISFKAGNYGPTWPKSAMTLACHGDLQGFDSAMQRMGDPSSAGNERRYLETTLKSFLHWPENTPYFVEWYQNIRPQLHSGRDNLGQLSFWLDQGTPFDSGYFASMPQPITDTQR